MLFEEKEVLLKDGRTAVLRNARAEDSEALITYLKVTARETPFLIKEPEEITLSAADEQAFIKSKNDSERDLMLVAFVDGEHAGNCSFAPVSSFSRYSHRCSVAVALYQKFWQLGLGRLMLTEILKQAADCGYEQAELEVAAANTGAISLYESLGFVRYGTLRHDMKYRDGSYGDTHLMVKYLEK